MYLETASLTSFDINDKDDLIDVGGGVALRGSGQALGDSYDASFRQKQIHRTTKATIGLGEVVVDNLDANDLQINRDINDIQVITKHRDIAEIRVKYTFKTRYGYYFADYIRTHILSPQRIALD